jgi:hypothetical protein
MISLGSHLWSDRDIGVVASVIIPSYANSPEVVGWRAWVEGNGYGGSRMMIDPYNGCWFGSTTESTYISINTHTTETCWGIEYNIKRGS